MKDNSKEAWITADEYGRSLPTFTVNLLVVDINRSVQFYETVLGATCQYRDRDFSALVIGNLKFMLHADHTYSDHPWVECLGRGEHRGLGAELRLIGPDPDGVEVLAHKYGAEVVQPASTKEHGLREMMVSDPDGYVWAVGIIR